MQKREHLLTARSLGGKERRGLFGRQPMAQAEFFSYFTHNVQRTEPANGGPGALALYVVFCYDKCDT